MNKQPLIHKQSRSIVFPGHLPEILNNIPRSKAIVVGGRDITAVAHGELETAYLNKNGHNILSPIEVYYDFPKVKGKFDAFKHQKITAGFITLNNRNLVLNQMGCVDAETEYLSPTGWVKISEYVSGEVAQYHSETKKITFVRPDEYVKLPCTEMYHIKTRSGIDQLLSPEHRVLLEHKITGEIDVISAEYLYQKNLNWINRVRDSDKITFTNATIPVTFSRDSESSLPLSENELRLQVAVIADGYFSPRTKTTFCVVRLTKDRKKNRLRDLLLKTGIQFSETAPEYKGHEGFSIFKFNAPLRKKEFDSYFDACSTEQLKIITDEVVHWDGSFIKNKPSKQFFTNVKVSADFIQYAFSSTGYTARLTTYNRLSRGKPTTEYVVHIRDNGKPLGIAGISKNGERRLNITKTSSPDGFKYCFMVPSTFLLFRRNGCIFASGNTGKTESALYACDWLMKTNQVKKVLLVSPLSTIERVWADAIFHTFYWRTKVVLHGPAKKRKELLAEDVDFYITNYDGLKVLKEDLINRDDIGMICYDEASILRTGDTKLYESVKLLATKERRLCLMTGTPTPNAPTDAWSLGRLVNPENTPKYFGTFKKMTMHQVSQFKYVPKHDSHITVNNTLQPAILFRRDECLDLPPNTIQRRQCELSQEQKKLFKDMREEMLSEIKSGVEITAVNAADKLGKLLQIASGSVKDPVTGDYHDIPCDSRVKVLLEVIEECPQKVLVFCDYSGPLRMITKMLRQNGIDTEFVDGSVDSKSRNDIFTRFQETDQIKVLVANSRTVSHGLTLTKATVAVWFVATHSLERFNQANMRINRPGQTMHTTTVLLGATPIEWAIYDKLEDRDESMNNALDLYKSFVNSN